MNTDSHFFAMIKNLGINMGEILDRFLTYLNQILCEEKREMPLSC